MTYYHINALYLPPALNEGDLLMNKEVALNNFVRRNYKLLKDKDNFDKKKFKDIKKAYFGKELRHKFGSPPDKEICDCFIELLIKTQRVYDMEALEQIISNTPLLKMNNIKSNNYKALIDSITGKYEIDEGLQGLSRIEKQEKIFEHIKKKSKKEIEDTIQQKKEEYLRLPSILDDLDFDEPEELHKREEAKEWWEELSLKEDPFPGALDGFSLIDKSFYDEIVVETPPIHWALNKIDKAQVDFFHRGYLLDGEFGTGKTTFFDFVAPHLSVKHIEPIRIALSDNINVEQYVQKYEKRICMEIAKIAKKYSIPDMSKIIDYDEASLLMLEVQDKGAKGFFVFIDDLHKHSNTNRVFNFLAQLQIAKNNFSREGINVAFVISGFPSWRDRIKQDSALTSFFDAADELTLPEVTPELAAQVIKKRLHAFSINPAKELAVREDFLRAIFRKVSSDVGRSNIGFRPYIQEAARNFQEKKFDILSIDYSKLDQDTKHQIRLVLESDSDFKEGISKLVFGGGIKKPKVREMTIKVLCEIYLRKGTSEDEEIFDRNKFAFKRLSECGFINKYDRKGKLVWRVSYLLNELNKKIMNQFHLSMEDYLVPIYYDTPVGKIIAKKKKHNKVEKYKQNLKEWETKLETDLILNLRTALTMYSESLFPLTETKSKKSYLPNLLPEIEKIKECVWMMMKCLIRFESPRILDICGESNILGWTLRHRTLEYTQHFVSLEQNVDSERSKVDITRLISFANDSFSELWNEFGNSMNIYQSCRIKCYALPRVLLNTIYSEYNNLFFVTQPREEYFNSLDNFVKAIEKIIRKYLLVSCSLIFGQYHRRFKYYPNTIKQYITKNITPSSVSYEGYNEFENLNRGQYRYLFTGAGKSSDFYRFVIKPLVNKWDSQDMESFFELFGDTNIITSHIKTHNVEDIKKDVPTFFRLSCRLVSNITERLNELITSDNTIISKSDSHLVIFGYQHKEKGVHRRIVEEEKDEDIPSVFCRYEINTELLTNKFAQITECSDNVFGNTELDLLNIEATRIQFNNNYCESIALIAYLLHRNLIRLITMYGSDVCIIK